MSDDAPEPETEPAAEGEPASDADATPEAVAQPQSVAELAQIAETTLIEEAPPWQAVHERFQRGLVHRGGRYEWAHPLSRSWRHGSVAILRPAGQREQRLWLLVPLQHLNDPDRIRQQVILDNTVLALAADRLPPPQAVADLEQRAQVPVVIFSPDGVLGGPRGEEPAAELRATLAYDDATLDAVDVDAAFGRLNELDDERTFHQRLRQDMPKTWLTTAICWALVVVWVLQIGVGLDTELPSPKAQLAWGACQAGLIRDEPWRLFSAGLLHYGLLHLGFNVFGTLFFGRLTERLLGRPAFAAVFVLSIVAGFLASCAWNPTVVSAGASGGVFGVLGAIAGFALRRRRELPRRVFLRLGGIVGILIGLNFGLTVWMSVALPIDNAGHLGGLLMGLICGLLLARPIPLAQLSRKVQSLVICGLLLATAGGYFVVREVPGVVHQRTLWKSGASGLLFHFFELLQRTAILERNQQITVEAIADLRTDLRNLRISAPEVLADEDGPRRLRDATVAAAEALDRYLNGYLAADGTLRSAPPDKAANALIQAMDAAVAAQRLD